MAGAEDGGGGAVGAADFEAVGAGGEGGGEEEEFALGAGGEGGDFHGAAGGGDEVDAVGGFGGVELEFLADNLADATGGEGGVDAAGVFVEEGGEARGALGFGDFGDGGAGEGGIEGGAAGEVGAQGVAGGVEGVGGVGEDAVDAGANGAEGGVDGVAVGDFLGDEFVQAIDDGECLDLAGDAAAFDEFGGEVRLGEVAAGGDAGGLVVGVRGDGVGLEIVFEAHGIRRSGGLEWG